MVNILIVEDDKNLNRLFYNILKNQHYSVFQAYNGDEALEIVYELHIDLMITDIMMPLVDGFELIQLLRESHYNMPIMILTAKESYIDKKLGFTLGVDDYMVKPINIDEMALRVKAILRRSQINEAQIIVLGDSTISAPSLTLIINGKEQLLPKKEFELLYKLASYPNKIFTRRQLMEEIWGGTYSEERTVDVHIKRIRNKIEKSVSIKISTVRGLGYKLEYTNEKN